MDSTTGASRDSSDDKRYEYFAFISYKHEDMRWAKWLQQQIETYRLPAIIRKQAPHLPRHIRPVFRDQTDISTGPLLQNLRQELQDSRFLIVLCSPAAAKSEWVNREVQHFIDMGRADRIIPFVVAGTPNAANPDEECFPAILRGAERSMLGVSVPELGKEKAFVKVVAKLLGLKFDRLWDRHRRRQRRQRLVRGLMAVALFLAAATGGFAYWDYHRTKIAYYADYVECRGVPQGIGELSAAQAQRRHLSWKFESSRYRVDRLDEHQRQRPAHGQRRRRLPGRPVVPLPRQRRVGIRGRAHADRQGVPRVGLCPGLVDRRVQGGEQGAVADAGPVLARRHGGAEQRARHADRSVRSEIAAWELKYDDLGRVVRRTYLNQSGYPTSDANGIYVQEFTYTPAGRVESVRYLDIGGQPRPTKQGIAGLRNQYDDRGNRIQVTWIGSKGTPVLNADGYAIEKLKYDADGNLVEAAFFGTDGKPCLHKNGSAGWKAAYDGRGNRTGVSYFGTDGKPCLHKDGFAASEGPVRRAGKPHKLVFLRDRRQALPAHGRGCPVEEHLRPAGKPDQPVLVRHRRQALPGHGWGCPVEEHFRRPGKPDQRLLLRRRRQALPAQGRDCRLEGPVRRAGKQDQRIITWHRRQALSEQGRLCRLGVHF